MNEQELIDITRDSIWLAMQIAFPVMMVALIVGVVVGLFQALTQIQEMTLTFVPKILAIMATCFLLMPVMFTLLRNFTLRLTDMIISGGSAGGG